MKIFKLLLLATLFYSFTGCESKSKKEVNQTVLPQSEQNTTAEQEVPSEPRSFSLTDIEDHNRTLTIVNKEISISGVSQRLILVNFFATWCPPCKGEIPYLADLQKKYKDSLFVSGILINDEIKKEALVDFMQKNGINYSVFRSKENDTLAKFTIKKLQLPEEFPLPLTVLFKEGHYYSHYEGAVPVEMLEHDIKNAIKK